MSGEGAVQGGDAVQLQGGHAGEAAGQRQGGEAQRAQGDAPRLLQVADQRPAGQRGNPSGTRWRTLRSKATRSR